MATGLTGQADSTETAPALRREVRAFLRGALDRGDYRSACDAWQSAWDPAFSRRLAEMGWVGVTIPVQYGGHGRSPLERFAVTEELLAAGAPVAAHWVADRQIAPSLLRYGSEEQRQRFLPAIARGECYFAIGMSEPDSGSDLASVRTTAVRAGGGWVLEGTKLWSSGAHRAHAMVVLARSERLDPAHRHVGLSQFIVTTDSPNLEIRPILLATGEHHFNEVVFSGTFVPDSMVLGELGSGWKQVTSELAYERSGPERYLSTYPLLDHTVTACRARPDRAIEQELGIRLARLWALHHMSSGVSRELAAGRDVNVTASLVKDLGTRFESEVVETARLLLDPEPDPGSPDSGVELFAHAVAHLPTFTLRGGTNEILRGVVARGLGLR
jgi:acyl-CoA dehydrogenase